jgi:hypothetical protein
VWSDQIHSEFQCSELRLRQGLNDQMNSIAILKQDAEAPEGELATCRANRDEVKKHALGHKLQDVVDGREAAIMAGHRQMP